MGAVGGKGGQAVVEGEVRLVLDNEGISGPEGVQDALGQGGGGPGGIEDHEEKVGGLDLLQGTADALFLDGGGGLVEAGGIDDTEQVGPDVDPFLDIVAGGTRLGGDDDPVLAGEGIEQAGFADIGLTEDDALDAVVEEGGILPGGDEVVHVGNEGEELPGGAFLVLRGQVLLGKINVGLEHSRDA